MKTHLAMCKMRYFILQLLIGGSQCVGDNTSRKRRKGEHWRRWTSPTGSCASYRSPSAGSAASSRSTSPATSSRLGTRTHTRCTRRFPPPSLVYLHGTSPFAICSEFFRLLVESIIEVGLLESYVLSPVFAWLWPVSPCDLGLRIDYVECNAVWCLQ